MKPPSVTFTAGVFDLLHAGHISLLWRARQLGDLLLVGVVSDAGTLAYKGVLPIWTLHRRMQEVGRLSFVDGVFMQATTDPTPLLERLRPDRMCHGDDWSRLRQGHETLDRLGIEWVLLPYTPGISTTQLRGQRVA